MQHQFASMSGVNIPWIADNGVPPYEVYARAFARARDEGYRVCRVWAAPWEVGRGDSVDGYVDSRIAHFTRLTFEAEKAGVLLMPCIHSHVEFLENNILREVADRRHGWIGSPLAETCGGPYRRPRDFFETIEIPLRIVRGILQASRAEAIVAIEVINEIDRLDEYRLVDAASWFESLAGHFDQPILVSAADPWNSLMLAEAARQPFAACHFHGWPIGNARAVAAAVERLAQRTHATTIWTEVSNDSQAPPRNQAERDLFLLTCQTVAAESRSPVYPWWWLEVSGLSQVCRPPRPPAATVRSSAFMRNVRQPAAWIRLGRSALMLWFPWAAATGFNIALATNRRRQPLDTLR